jgi:hypothetical protein
MRINAARAATQMTADRPLPDPALIDAVDTRGDLALLRALVAELPDAPASCRDGVAVLRTRPDLVAISSGVRRKPLAAG